MPRRALRWPTEVAAALGVSDDFLRDHGLIAELPVVRLGTLRLVAVEALDAWLAERAVLPLEARPLQGNRTCGDPETPVSSGDPSASETRVKSGRRSWA